ncbi:MAG: hypothetical protein AAFV95_08325 [Bacteroidota bacterium]
MNKNFTYYFIPAFILLYFVIAALPIVGILKGEFFPFFSFKLYSKIPNDFSAYDLLIYRGDGEEKFLLHQNSHLDALRRKGFKRQVNLLGSQFEKTNSLGSVDYSEFVSMGDSVFLVKLSGDYIQAVKHDDYQMTVLKKLK